MAKLYNIKNADVNSITVQGRVGQDPQWREVGDGLLTFSVATTESWKDKGGEWQERTEWHNVSVFGKAASYLNGKFSKGDVVRVTGRLTSNKKDDKTFYSIRPDFAGVQVVAVSAGSSPPAATVDEDELPF